MVISPIGVIKRDMRIYFPIRLAQLRKRKPRRKQRSNLNFPRHFVPYRSRYKQTISARQVKSTSYTVRCTGYCHMIYIWNLTPHRQLAGIRRFAFWSLRILYNYQLVYIWNWTRELKWQTRIFSLGCDKTFGTVKNRNLYLIPMHTIKKIRIGRTVNRALLAILVQT